MVAPRSVVYALSLDGTTHRYVGMTSGRLAARTYAHRREARDGTLRPVYDWMRKHGPDNVVAVVLETCPDPLDLYAAEQRWITTLRAQGHDLLNLADGGPGPLGHKRSPEYVEAMRKRVVSPETRQRMSEAAKRRGAPNKGVPMSEEQREKIRQARLGSRLSEETRAKQSAAHKGKPKSPEHAARIGAAVRAAAQRRREAREAGRET